MFQIIFNELSAAEMSALPKKMQLDLLAEFQILPEDLGRLDAKHFGVIEREGKKLYRYRAKDYRIYFEQTRKGSPSTASCTRTRFAISFSGANFRARKIRRSAERASSGN
jgi:mRNA-degrading endonuclease RelE of RelBE toxin-antitoxin system